MITVFLAAFLAFWIALAGPAADKKPSKTTVPNLKFPEAPASFDGASNGMVDEATHTADREKFDEMEGVADGLGPLFNAQSCRECHQNPQSGGGSQITELRVGHLGPGRVFVNPSIPIARGAEIITGRTLVNDRAICPNSTYPDVEIQERVPELETVRTTRVSLNVLGDGFIEAVPDRTLIEIARSQCASSHGKICGVIIYVPIIEVSGQAGVGRFGWKNQHASLLSFSGDAYLNEMGITTHLFPDEVTNLCNTAAEPNDKPGPDGLADVDHFARFIRATKAPPQDVVLAKTPDGQRGSGLFEKIGCAFCHVRTLTTAPAGTKINGGAYTIPAALGGKTFHPYSDLLMHDVGTGDGIVIPVVEHYGRAVRRMPHECSRANFDETQNRVRTPPLWGLRLRTRLMHDGASITLRDAVLRHAGEAESCAHRFRKLPPGEQEQVLQYLRSL